MGLERIKESLKLCWLCGGCFGRGPTEPHNWRELNPDPSPNLRCPSYEYFKFRTYTAMDRNTLATLMYREGYPISDSLKKVIYSCVQCGVCSEICGLVDPVEINRAAREEIAEKSSLLPGHQRLRQTQAQSGNPYGRPDEDRAKWAKRLGIKDLTKEKAANLFFVGCSGSIRPVHRKTAARTAELFQWAGLDFGILGSEEKCCGYISRMLGDRERFEQTMEANIALIRSLGIKRLITSCPGCLLTFKSYPKEKLNFEVLHSTQVLEGLIRTGRLTPSPVEACKVTYHDPCELGRGCGVYDSPRNLINDVPGVQLVEMPRHGRWSYCCGGGGGLGNVLPEMADSTAHDRFSEAEGTGAEMLITACPQCHMAFRRASGGKKNRGIPVKDIHVFLAESMLPPGQSG